MQETTYRLETTPLGITRLKRFVPRPLKHAVKEALRERRFRRALCKVADLPNGAVPNRDLLVELQTGWGNESFSAKYDYLEEVINRAATTAGPILECGSGLTSILLGLIAGRRDIEIWTLEHIPQWHARLGAILKQHRIPGVNLSLAPLREYEGFSWYDPPLEVLPDNFSLVICDGPPGSTPGGRYGLFPLINRHMAREGIILLDDADRPGETQTLNRWVAEYNVSVSMRVTPTGAFAVVTNV